MGQIQDCRHHSEQCEFSSAQERRRRNLSEGMRKKVLRPPARSALKSDCRTERDSAGPYRAVQDGAIGGQRYIRHPTWALVAARSFTGECVVTSLVTELQREALDGSVRAADLLRKALVVARKLKIKNIQPWLKSELDGYSESEEVPEYRWVNGEIKAWNPYNGIWMPMMFGESMADIHRTLTNRKCGQSVAELEDLLENRSGMLIMPYPSEMAARLTNAMGIISKVTPTPLARYGSVQSVIAHFKESRYDPRRGGPAGAASGRGADYPPTHRLTGRRGTFRYNPQCNRS